MMLQSYKENERRARKTPKKNVQIRFVPARIYRYLWIIHILAIEGHDVVQHALGLDSRTVRVEFYGLDVAVDGLVPLLLFAGLVAKLVIIVCCHFL